LRFPAVSRDAAIRVWPELAGIAAPLFQSLAVYAAYARYVERQDVDVAGFHRDEALALVPGLDFSQVPGLSHEMVERLSRAGPPTLGAASRVPGITPAALVALLPYARKAA